MKAEVTVTRRPKSGREGAGKVRYLDINFDGWKMDVDVPSAQLDNGRKPHGGYKGLPKHPMGVHSFQKGADFQQHLRQARQTQEVQERQSPTWALQAHRTITHSGESPLISARLMSASKHETSNGWSDKDKDSPRATRSAGSTPHHPNTTKKASASYYRPNSTHQYLTATELKDAADCQEVIKLGRPTRTTLLRARQRVSSASSNAYEVRRQNEQRMREIAKVAAFCSPEELTPEYSDAQDQSFYSFLMGARYNRAHCLDSKSLARHGVYMPRHNPLGCFVITDRDPDHTAPAPHDSPRSDIGEPAPSSRPQVMPRRPTTAPSFGRNSSSRKTSARQPRTPRSQRTPRQAWGDVTVSLHVTNGSRQTFTLHPKEAQGKFGPRLPVVQGTSLAKLHRQQQQLKDAEQPPAPAPAPPAPAPSASAFPAAAAEDASEILGQQPPPTPTSARGGDNLFPPTPIPAAVAAPQNSLDLPEEREEENETKEEEKEEKEEEEESSPGGKPDPQPEPEATTTELPEPDENGAAEAIGKVTQENQLTDETSDEQQQQQKQEAEQIHHAQDTNRERESGDDETEAETITITKSKEQEENMAERKPEAETEGDVRKGENSEELEEEKGETEGGVKGELGSGQALTETEADDETKLTADVTARKQPAENDINDDDNVRFFVTEEEAEHVDANQKDPNNSNSNSKPMSSGGDDGDSSTPCGGNSPPDNNVQGEDDAQSTTSSKKSQSKHVSFTIPAQDQEDSLTIADHNDDGNNETDDDNNNNNNLAHANNSSEAAAVAVAEVSDSDLDDPEQGQGQGQAEEPLRVVVTHIEKSMGAPAPREGAESP